MTIPLMKHAFFHDAETRRALADFVATADKLSMGDQCAEFERQFAAWQGRQYAVLFNSGASANLALLQALKNLQALGDGNRIGFSALTWSTNVMPIIQLGMVPVPIDVKPETLNVIQDVPPMLDMLFITNALGMAPCSLYDVAPSRYIIEDNCEALGTELNGIKTGNFGIASTFSFYVAHHMSTIEGGVVCTDNRILYDRLIMVRANGWDRNLPSDLQAMLRSAHHITSEFDAKYTFYDLAYNLRPTEITGFLGLRQLKYLNENITARQRIFKWLHATTLTNPDLIPLDVSHLSRISAFAFPVLCKTPELRALYLARFEAAGIEVRPMIAGNITRQPFWRKYIIEQYDLPGADFVHERGFYCGCYPELTDEEVRQIDDCLREVEKVGSYASSS